MSDVHNTTNLAVGQPAPPAAPPADQPAATQPADLPAVPSSVPAAKTEVPEPPKAAEAKEEVKPAKKTHKAAIYDKPGTISTKLVDVETPEPGPGEVLVQLTASGVCHSDLGIMTQSWAQLPAPCLPTQVGGHEGVGKVAAVGPGVNETGVKVGDRVGIKWINSACGNCKPCLAGHDGSCKKVKISGFYTPGTFQQYAIAPAHYVTPIPAGLNDQDAACHLCAGVTVYAALRKSGAQPGDWVAVVGAGGGLGHIAVQLAARGFSYRVVGIDADAKAALVRDSGAEHFVGLGPREAPTDTVAEIMRLTDDVGVQAVVVCASANGAYASALPMLKYGGRVVCVGIPEGQLTAIASAYPQVLIGKELSIVGSAVGNRKDAIEVLDFAARGVIKVHTRLEKLDKLTEVFQEMHEGKLQGRVVVDLVNI